MELSSLSSIFGIEDAEGHTVSIDGRRPSAYVLKGSLPPPSNYSLASQVIPTDFVTIPTVDVEVLQVAKASSGKAWQLPIGRVAEENHVKG